MPRRLAVVAGTGALAPQVIEAALAVGDTVRAFALAPLALPPGAEQQPASIARPAALFDAIRDFEASHLVLAGAVTLIDADRQQLLAVLGGGEGQPTGDAALSQLATRLQQLTGAALVGPHQIVPDLLAPSGRIAGPEASAPQLEAARLALVAARQIGALDLGQAAVVAGARVVAAEDVAGTDDLLARTARHRAAGLIGNAAETPLVLAKACKPQQPLFVDLPAIGPETVRGASNAGMSLIALEAGRTLLLERRRLVDAANAAGIAVIGLAIDG
jgi:DUF1009 family protein